MNEIKTITWKEHRRGDRCKDLRKHLSAAVELLKSTKLELSLDDAQTIGRIHGHLAVCDGCSEVIAEHVREMFGSLTYERYLELTAEYPNLAHWMSPKRVPWPLDPARCPPAIYDRCRNALANTVAWIRDGLTPMPQVAFAHLGANASALDADQTERAGQLLSTLGSPDVSAVAVSEAIEAITENVGRVRPSTHRGWEHRASVGRSSHSKDVLAPVWEVLVPAMLIATGEFLIVLRTNRDIGDALVRSIVRLRNGIELVFSENLWGLDAEGRSVVAIVGRGVPDGNSFVVPRDFVTLSMDEAFDSKMEG